MEAPVSSVGGRIREIREEIGMTQEQLAARSEISKGFLSEVENDRRNLSSENLLKIATALGASVEYLLTGASPASSQPRAIEVPVELSRIAEDLHLTHGETIGLLEAYQSVIARRNRQGTRRFTEQDWRELYKALEPFLGKR
jgi:transcriptional regulator with XRE-family HTH domain